MKAFSHINIGEKISFIIGCKNYLILIVSKKTDIPCANCTRPCAQCTSFNLALQALSISILVVLHHSFFCRGDQIQTTMNVYMCVHISLYNTSDLLVVVNRDSTNSKSWFRPFFV